GVLAHRDALTQLGQGRVAEARRPEIIQSRWFAAQRQRHGMLNTELGLKLIAWLRAVTELHRIAVGGNGDRTNTAGVTLHAQRRINRRMGVPAGGPRLEGA